MDSFQPDTCFDCNFRIRISYQYLMNAVMPLVFAKVQRQLLE